MRLSYPSRVVLACVAIICARLMHVTIAMEATARHTLFVLVTGGFASFLLATRRNVVAGLVLLIISVACAATCADSPWRRGVRSAYRTADHLFYPEEPKRFRVLVKGPFCGVSV